MKNSFVAKIIFISLLSSNLRASSKPDNHKEEDKIRSVLCPARTRLDPETKRLFIPSTMPFRFFMNPLVEGSTPIALEQTAENPEKYLHFPEGEHNIAIPATSKQVYRLVADANPPVTGISLAEVPHVDKYGKSFYGKGFSVTLTAIDSVSGLDKIFMALNGSHFSELMKSMLRFPENGEFKLQYFSCDRVGNKEALQRMEFSVDVTAPVTSLQVKNPGNGSALGPNAFLALRSLDAGVGVANIEYQFDGGPKKIYESELALSELVSGKHSLVYWASDHLQNREISHKFDFNLDLLAPELSVSFLGPSYRETDLVFVSNSTKIQLDSQDKQSGVSSVKYAINGKYQVPKSNTISLSGLNGLQNFVGLVTDQAGNATKLEEKILMDSEAPAVEYEFIGSSFFHDNQFVVSSPLQIKLIAKDKASGIDKVFYCLNDLPCKIYQDVIAINSPGPMSFSFYAQDRVQNLSPKKTLRLLLKDNKSNASAKPKSEKMQWVSDRESGAIGPAGQRYRLEIADGPGLDALKFSFNIPKYILENDSIRSGPLQKIRLSLAGYQADIAIPIDAEAPRSKHSFTGAKTFRREEKDYFGPGLKISFAAEDKSDSPNSGTRKILYSINGAPFSIFESPLSQFLAEQTYVFHYYASDRVGNREKEHEFSFVLDLTPPKSVLKFIQPYSRQVIGPKGGIEILTEDNLSGVAAVYVGLDQAEEFVYSKDAVAKRIDALPEGEHVVSFYAIDAVGNKEPKQSVKFWIDHDGPELSKNMQGPTFEVGQNLFVNKGAKIFLEGSDKFAGLEEIRYQFDSGPEEKYKNYIDLKSIAKSSNIKFWGFDKVKNPSKISSLKIEVDDKPPQSHLEFRGKYYIIEQKIFVKTDSEITIKSADDGAGVQHIYYRINSNDFVPMSQPLKFSQRGEYNLSFYAVDRVMNRETPIIYRVIVDDERPIVQIKSRDGSVLANAEKISTGSLLYVSAYDSQSGIKEIYYSLDGGDLLLYRHPIYAENPGPLKIEVKATDWMGEEDHETLNYMVQ